MDPEEKPETTSAASGGGGGVTRMEPVNKSETTSTGGGVISTEPVEKPQTTSSGDGSSPPTRLDCIKCFDALWFCYSPFHQMQRYNRHGDFDNCFGKWGDLVDCLSLKTKREAEEILVAREKARPHIWTYRTVDEATENWWRMYKHKVMMSKPANFAAPPSESGGIS